jgi:thiol-disulfide isomerase/thioredoxin
MKHSIFAAWAVIILLFSCSPKNTPYKTKASLTDNSGKPMLLGQQPISALKKAPFGDWFNKNYAAYQANDNLTEKIKPLLQDKQLLVFLGTWCGDSKREVPRMLKILDHYGVSHSNVKLIMLDEHDSVYKQSPAHEEKGLNIHRVPTFIVYQNQAELGRIVESPVVTLEKDLLQILSGEDYIPKYRGVIFMENLFRIVPPDSVVLKQVQVANLIKPILKNSGELNTYGYVLMAAKQPAKALAVFKLNTVLYPSVANVFDSLGEFYLHTGNKKLARENYLRVLELDSKNENAKKMLEKIDL